MWFLHDKISLLEDVIQQIFIQFFGVDSEDSLWYNTLKNGFIGFYKNLLKMRSCVLQ